MFWCRHCRAEMPNYSPLQKNFCTNCRNWQDLKDDPHRSSSHIAPLQYEPYPEDLDHEDLGSAGKVIGFTVLLLPIWYFFTFKWYISALILICFLV